jgi:hypothetical protein
LSDLLHSKNGLKRGDALSSLRFNSALKYAVRRVQVNRDGLKFTGTHQLLIYADDVNILDGNVHNVKKNTEVLFVSSREIRLEVNAGTNKYMVLSLRSECRKKSQYKN